MHPALKKTILVMIVFAALLIGLPIAGRLITKGIHAIDEKAGTSFEKETEPVSVLDSPSARFLSLKDAAASGTGSLPLQELLETKIPYTEKEKSVIALNSPLIINEPAPYGEAGARFIANDEEREKFTNLAVLFCAYNFGEAARLQEIEFQDLLYYDTVVLQYRAVFRLTDEERNSLELVLDAGHNIDESIFYITTQLPDFYDYEKRRGETETEWEDANA